MKEQTKTPLRNRIANILRWIVFVPGGLLGGMLTGIAGLLFFGAMAWLGGLAFDAPIVLFVAGFWSGYAAVASGAWIAPSPSKTLPAVIVAAIGFLLGCVAIYFRVTNQEWFRSVEGLCVLVGTLVAMMQHIKRDGP